MELGLKGRTAIVCGASSGMGLAIAEGLVAEGANVAMLARRRDVLEREAERIGALPVRGDVTVPADLERLVERTVAAFGGVDVLVLNSGGPPRSTAVDVTEESLEDTVRLLFGSSVHLVRLCLPHLRRSGRGRIVAIASTSVKEPIDGLALSNSVRPGLIGWLKSLSRELGPEAITVNAIAPGWIDTERLREVAPDGPSAADLARIPLRRLGEPREIANVVCFLASEQGAYVSGTTIAVDGGMTRSLL
jgi:3-oxoacyl-[acyl-carrier protein] reductase